MLEPVRLGVEREFELRLAHAGLRPDQLARLSGLSDAEVAELLHRGPSA